MIGHLPFLQAVGVDGVSAVRPMEVNRFILHQAALYEKGRDRVTDRVATIFHFTCLSLPFLSSHHRKTHSPQPRMPLFYHQIVKSISIRLFFEIV